MEAINITAYTSDATHIEAVKALFKALKVKFEVSKKTELYNPAFVEKILRSEKQIAEGKFTEVKGEDLKSFIDGL